jgi:hypothetical protein
MDLIVLVSMPSALSSTTIDPGSTAIEIILGFLTGIERVVHQLLEHHEGPLLDAVPHLVLQFPPSAELHQPRDLEGHSRQLRLGFPASGPLGLATICKDRDLAGGVLSC